MIKTFETAQPATLKINHPLLCGWLLNGCWNWLKQTDIFLGATAGESPHGKYIRLPGCTSFDSTPRWPSLAVRVETRRPWNLRRSPFGRVKQGAGTRWRWKRWHATWPRNIGIIVTFSLILEEFEVSLDGTFWCWTYPTWRDHLMLKYLDLLWQHPEGLTATRRLAGSWIASTAQLHQCIRGGKLRLCLKSPASCEICLNASTLVPILVAYLPHSR